MEFFARILFYIFHKSFDIDNEQISQKLARDIIIIIDIIFRIIFNLYIVKGELFNHKKCTIVFMLFIFLLLILMDIINLNSTNRYDITNCFIFFGVLSPSSIIYPFIDTIAKKMMVDN